MLPPSVNRHMWMSKSIGIRDVNRSSSESESRRRPRVLAVDAAMDCTALQIPTTAAKTIPVAAAACPVRLRPTRSRTRLSIMRRRRTNPFTDDADGGIMVMDESVLCVRGAIQRQRDLSVSALREFTEQVQARFRS
jgi:hypothetical protein